MTEQTLNQTQKEPIVSTPEYRFECHIIDQNMNELVISASTFLSQIHTDGSCESVDMEVASMLRAFQQKIRAKYEMKNYNEEGDE